MALRTIRIQGDPVLTKKCREITEMTPKIKELIDKENPAKPLSDEQLAQMLKAGGLAVARRTVAKYREGMNIPSSSLRRKHM